MTKSFLQNLAFTNKCYISQIDLLQLCPTQGEPGGTGYYVEAKSCVFSVEAHRAMEQGTIAFNKVQREFAKIGLNQEARHLLLHVRTSFAL